MEGNRKLILIILDGWGIGSRNRADAIYNAFTPAVDKLLKQFPNSQLLTCGENVGLPEGQMGNSEVGHLNIGAGRIIYQDLVKINKAIRENTIQQNRVLNEAFQFAKERKKDIHLLGLVSDGGVHSSGKHLYKLCDMAKERGLDNVYIHALLDGRDCNPRSGLKFIGELREHLVNSTGKIASLCGRYYTMDRDRRWDRIKQGYDLLVNGTGTAASDPVAAIMDSYSKGITDEFIEPVVCVNGDGGAVATVKEGDVVICFNFRTDRLREITTVLTQEDLPEEGMKTLPLYFVTMTRYNDSFKNVHVVFEKDNIDMTLGEVLSKEGKKQLRISETEKYPHVTFFFSGGRESRFEGEDRILIPSPKVPTYDMQPEMSAPLVKDAVVAALGKRKYDFICLNFANGDMVGHTGVYDAIIKAVETVDSCVGEVITAARINGYDAIIIADHGNADYALNDNGTPNTAHSMNPVPCIFVGNEFKSIQNGVLADIAPTILKIMRIKKPEQMTGKVLV